MTIIITIFCYIQTSDAFPYMRGTRIPRLLGVRHEANNYFAMHKSLTRSITRVELASPAYSRFGIT